jgi:aspartyl-tRNA(Asn)/glutamyl-tRNA(Gln) amidotransferase subunit A
VFLYGLLFHRHSEQKLAKDAKVSDVCVRTVGYDKRSAGIPLSELPATWYAGASLVKPYGALSDFDVWSVIEVSSNQQVVTVPKIPETIAFASVREIGRRLRADDFSCVELAVFFLGRLKTIGPKLNAVATVTHELAVQQAKQADLELKAGKERGPLHGIPYGVKDLLATEGIPTSWGAAPFRDRIIDADSTVVARLREAGAVLIGKLAMVEIAGGLGYRQANASFTGPGLNPWDTSRWAGGSSSGPGSAVGGGLVPFAIGSETWGSIMTPAGFCGISGLRPTYGRVSRHGAMALAWTVDKLGPMCRTADDCGIVLNAIAGEDPADESCVDRSYEYPLKEQPGKKEASERYKVATLKDSAKSVQPEVRANYDESLTVLRKFCEIEEVELPDFPWTAVASTLINCESAAAFEGLISTGDIWEMTAKEDHWGIHAAMVIPAKDYINAMRIRSKMQHAIDSFLKPFDAVVTPTLATTAYPNDRPWGEHRRGFHSSQITNLGGAGAATGIPALSIPNGLGEGGLPTGLQLAGRTFSENKLVEIANRYQEATDFHKATPQPLG